MNYKSHIETVLHYINMQIRHDWSLEPDEAFNESISIDMLSRVACLSRRNFQLVFKSVTKETPRQYINRVRLESGLQLLKVKRYSQKEIAERTGWTNDTAFYNAFRKKYLQSPAKYGLGKFNSSIVSGPVGCSLLEFAERPIVFLIYQGCYADYASGCIEEKVGKGFMIMLNQMACFLKKKSIGAYVMMTGILRLMKNVVFMPG